MTDCLTPSRCAHLCTGTRSGEPNQWCGNARNKHGMVTAPICKSMGLYETAQDVRARNERSGNVRKDL